MGAQNQAMFSLDTSQTSLDEREDDDFGLHVLRWDQQTACHVSSLKQSVECYRKFSWHRVPHGRYLHLKNRKNRITNRKNGNDLYINGCF